MTVIRKPKSVDEFIGGATAVAETPPADQSTKDVRPLKMRMPADLIQEIDELRSLRKPRPSRHQYILAALYDQVKRERDSE